MVWDGQDYERWTIDELQSRVRNGLVRGVVKAANDNPMLQTVDLQLEDGIRPTKVEHWHPYGFTHHPQDGAEVLVASLGGNRDHMVAFPSSDRRYRIKVAKGEVAIHDDQGQKVHITRDGVVVDTPKKADVKAGESARIEAPTITLKGNLVIEGDITHTGNMNTSGVHTDSNGVHV